MKLLTCYFLPINLLNQSLHETSSSSVCLNHPIYIMSHINQNLFELTVVTEFVITVCGLHGLLSTECISVAVPCYILYSCSIEYMHTI